MAPMIGLSSPRIGPYNGVIDLPDGQVKITEPSSLELGPTQVLALLGMAVAGGTIVTADSRSARRFGKLPDTGIPARDGFVNETLRASQSALSELANPTTLKNYLIQRREELGASHPFNRIVAQLLFHLAEGFKSPDARRGDMDGMNTLHQEADYFNLADRLEVTLTPSSLDRSYQKISACFDAIRSHADIEGLALDITKDLAPIEIQHLLNELDIMMAYAIDVLRADLADNPANGVLLRLIPDNNPHRILELIDKRSGQLIPVNVTARERLSSRISQTLSTNIREAFCNELDKLVTLTTTPDKIKNPARIITELLKSKDSLDFDNYVLLRNEFLNLQNAISEIRPATFEVIQFSRFLYQGKVTHLLALFAEMDRMNPSLEAIHANEALLEVRRFIELRHQIAHHLSAGRESAR